MVVLRRRYLHERGGGVADAGEVGARTNASGEMGNESLNLVPPRAVEAHRKVLAEQQADEALGVSGGDQMFQEQRGVEAFGADAEAMHAAVEVGARVVAECE